jgi:hypothetical protein
MENEEKKPRKKRATAVNNKSRGYLLEKAIVDLAKAYGLPCTRAWGSNGRALGYAPDVDGVIAGFPFQAKMKAAIPKWAEIPESCRAVIFRVTRGTPKALIEANWYMELLRVWLLWWDLPSNRKPTNVPNV